MNITELIEILTKLAIEAPNAGVYSSSEYDDWRVVNAELDEDGDVILELEGTAGAEK